MTGQEHMHNDPEAEEHYEENIETLSEITREGGITSYARSRVTKDAFKPKEALGMVTCADERTPEDGALRDPGGPLFAYYILGYSWEQIAAWYHAENVKVVKWHPGCGAAKAAYKKAKNIPASTDVSWDKVDAFAKSEIEAFAEKFHFTPEATEPHDMTSGGHFHPGVAVYLDDIGGFDWRKAEDMPQGYTVNGTISGDGARAVVALLTLVAFGAGNAGDRMRSAIQRGEPVPKFQVYILSPSANAFRAREAEIKNLLPPEVAPFIEFGMIEKPADVEVRTREVDQAKAA